MQAGWQDLGPAVSQAVLQIGLVHHDLVQASQQAVASTQICQLRAWLWMYEQRAHIRRSDAAQVPCPCQCFRCVDGLPVS